MARDDSSSFWSRFFSIPQEDESYLPYIVTLKFIWAPFVFIASASKDWLFGFFGYGDKNNQPLDGSAPNIPIPAPEGAPLYRSNVLAPVPAPELSAAEMALKIIEEFKKNPNPIPKKGNALGNTPLTAFLAMEVFCSRTNYLSKSSQYIQDVLTELCMLARRSSEDRELVRKLLTTPNNPDLQKNAEQIANGLPVNTPLMLLVKAGDSNAVQIVLPFYSAEDLMKTTPRGNSVFHIASITGQKETLLMLREQAETVGIWEAYTTSKNKLGHTAYDMLSALVNVNRSNLFQSIVEFAYPYLGADEVNKAAVSHDLEPYQTFIFRNTALEFYSILNSDPTPTIGVDSQLRR